MTYMTVKTVAAKPHGAERVYAHPSNFANAFTASDAWRHQEAIARDMRKWAKRENAARDAEDRSKKYNITATDSAARSERLQTVVERQKAQSDAFNTALLDAITADLFTARDASEVWGCHVEIARGRLSRMRDRARVVLVKERTYYNPAVYARAEAMGEPPEAIGGFAGIVRAKEAAKATGGAL